MSYRSPLAKAKGLGSAKEGAGHWWMERLTSAALIPLIVWLVYGLAVLGKADYQTLIGWVEQPAVAILLMVLILTLFYHSSLGIQVVAEDYISGKGKRLATIVIVNFINILWAVISVFAVLKIAFGAGA